ncbi:MAG: RNA polymerase sigma factor [Sandaracinaceae bacterium]
MGALLEESPPAAAEPIERTAAATLADAFDAHAAYAGRSLRCLGVRDAELPDAIQEVFLVVHRRAAEIERPEALRSFIYAVCVRKAMALRRTHARRRENLPGDLPERSTDQLAPDEELIKTRALRAALQLLDELDDDKRAVFVLYEVEQLPMREVADALGCPMQTAYARLYAARKWLDRRLKALRARREVER